MADIVLNKELHFTYPEGFHEMGEAERKKLNFIQEGPGIVISDPDRHIIVSIGWKKSGIGSLLLSPDDVARNMEKTVSRSMDSFSYQVGDFDRRPMDGVTAIGFDYVYEAKGIQMTGSSYVAEKGRTFYYFNFYGRTARKAENEEIWGDMLASVRWK